MARSDSGLGIGNRMVIVGVAAVAATALVAFVFSLTGLGFSLGIALGSAIGALIAVGGARWVTSPLNTAAAAAKHFVETGDAQMLHDAGGEMGSLMEAFGSVVDAAQVDKIFAENCVKSLCNPVYVTDLDGKVVMATKALLDLVKKPMTQVIGFGDGKVLWGSSTDSLAKPVLTSGDACLDRADEFTMASGEKLHLRAFASRVVDADGKTVGAIVSILNMHTIVEQQAKMEEHQAKTVAIGKEVSMLAERVASASEELSASADEQANGAMRQKEQTDTVATAMEEMTATVLEVAQNASATSEAASEANQSAGEGVSMVNQAVSAIHGVSDSAEKLAEMVQQLDEQSGQIGKIISVINDIADQTNLLALNAAIEAARAGEAGRGFAVVADEVRKLAEKTMVATKEVEQAIKTIQDRSKMLMTSMEETGQQVDASTNMANKAGESLQVIMEAIEDMVGRAAQIATAAEEQSAAAEEINHSIENIAQVASEADEGAGQTAAATRDMAELSQQLLGVSMQFSGKEQDSSKLRASEGEMKGVLPKLMQDFVKDTYGLSAFEAMQQEMGEPVFLPTSSYPDQVFVQMAEIAAREVGISPRDVFLAVGRFTMASFAHMYPRYLKDEPLKNFYMRMNDVHAQLTKAQPGIQPPNFTYEDKGDVLFMNYRSKRGFFDYFEGILLGASEYMNEPIELVVKPLDATTARAEIRFL